MSPHGIIKKTFEGISCVTTGIHQRQQPHAAELLYP